MNKAELIKIVQRELGQGISEQAAAEALDAMLSPAARVATKTAAPRRRTVRSTPPLSIPEALKRDVVHQGQVTVIQGTKPGGLMRNTKTLKKFKEQIRWK